MTMCGEEAAAMFPEKGPDLLAVGFGNFQVRQFFARDEVEPAFVNRRRQDGELWFHFKEKDEPMRISLIAVLADEAGQMQIGGRKRESGFLARFTAGADVRRFTQLGFQFAAARAPQAAVRLLRAFEQEYFVALVEDVEQRRDLVRQHHNAS